MYITPKVTGGGALQVDCVVDNEEELAYMQGIYDALNQLRQMGKLNTREVEYCFTMLKDKDLNALEAFIVSKGIIAPTGHATNTDEEGYWDVL